MVSPLVRLGLVALLVAVGGYQVSIDRTSGWLLLVAAGGLTYGYFRYGAVWAAWRALKAMKYDRAKALIETVNNPQLLAPQQRAYYHFTQGILRMRDSKFGIAAEHLASAAEGSLRTSNDRSVALLTLAEAKVKGGEIDVAREYLAKAKEMPHKDGLGEAIRQVESLVDEAR